MPRLNSDPQLQYYLRRQRRYRHVMSAFANLLASPADLSSPLRMPAGVRLGVSHSAGLTEGQVTISLGNGRQFSTPALAADARWKGDFAEEGQEVTVTGSPPGTLTLYLENPSYGSLEEIGTLATV